MSSPDPRYLTVRCPTCLAPPKRACTRTERQHKKSSRDKNVGEFKRWPHQARVRAYQSLNQENP